MSLKRSAARTLATAAAFVVVSFGLHGFASAAPVESCPQGAAAATVIDDNGNPQQACVAVEAVVVPVAAAPARTASADVGSLPSTGSTTNGALIGAGLVIAGAAASLASRRRA